MEPQGLKVLRKNVRVGSIDVHPREKSLVVNYEVEAAVIGPRGDTKLEETKEMKKVIKLKGLSEDTDLKLLASHIIEKCTLIPPSKHQEIEQLLYYLQTRKLNPNVTKMDVMSDPKMRGASADVLHSPGVETVANIGALDDYIELLYEGIPEKVQASALVLQLARKPDNLTVLSKNDILIGALARVLREDGRKSIELSTNIVYAFFCFSTFRQFHHVVAQHKVGSLCMELVEAQVIRLEQRMAEYQATEELLEQNKSNPAHVAELEKNQQKYMSAMKKLDQLLRVCFYLLYNISEDPKVEIKMVNRGIICFLAKCLKRDNPELLILVVSFLKKLSVFAENKNEMVQNNVTENVSRLVPHENIDLLNMVLRLLWNLSFDIDHRNNIVRCGFVPKFINLISIQQYQPVILGILYHISMEDRYKTLLTYIDCIPIVIRMVLEHPDKILPLHLIAFGINLAQNKRNAQLMCNNGNLDLLVSRAMHHQDSLLMKMIRNISQHDGTKEEFVNFVGDICDAITSIKDNDDFLVECLGTLGNLTVPEIDFEKLLVQYNLIDFMKDKFSRDTTEDDLILELIIITSTAAQDEACAMMILESSLIKSIIDFLNARQEDDEMVLQIVYLFCRLIFHVPIRETIIKTTQIPAYLIDLMHDKNPQIRKFCDLALDLISSHNEEWSKKIQNEKFRWHNCQWLEMVESQQIEDGDFYADESYTPCIQEADILSRSDLLYGCEAFENLLSDGSLSPDHREVIPQIATTQNS